MRSLSNHRAVRYCATLHYRNYNYIEKKDNVTRVCGLIHVVEEHPRSCGFAAPELRSYDLDLVESERIRGWYQKDEHSKGVKCDDRNRLEIRQEGQAKPIEQQEAY